MKLTSAIVATAALALAAPSAALAQDTLNGTDPVATTMLVEEEDEFPIGLLGLLGLAGLFGLKRKDDRVHHADTTNRNR